MARSKTLIELLWGLATSNIGTKIVSVVISIVLWAIVLGSRSVEVSKDVPLEVMIPDGLAVASEFPDKITFRLYGPKAFLRNILDRREEPIRINLAGTKPTLVTYRFFSDNIRVPIGVKVLSIHPSAISIKLERLKFREVPVRVQLQGTPPEGSKISKLEVRPEVVKIKGPESIIDKTNEIYTQPIEVTDMRASAERVVSLELPSDQVQLMGDLPRVSIQMDAPHANYRIKNVDIRVISSYKAVVEEKTVTLLVRAGSSDMESIDRSLVYGVINLSGKVKGKYKMPLKVNLPKNITLVKVIPEQVHVTLY